MFEAVGWLSKHSKTPKWATYTVVAAAIAVATNAELDASCFGTVVASRTMGLLIRLDAAGAEAVGLLRWRTSLIWPSMPSTHPYDTEGPPGPKNEGRHAT